MDLVVEAVSPESRVRDHKIKPEEYRLAGIPETFLADPRPATGLNRR